MGGHERQREARARGGVLGGPLLRLHLLRQHVRWQHAFGRGGVESEGREKGRCRPARERDDEEGLLRARQRQGGPVTQLQEKIKTLSFPFSRPLWTLQTLK